MARARDELPAVELVPMKRRHVRDVLMIERLVYPRPWSAGLFFSEINQKASRHYICAVVDGEVVGYGGVMVHADEAHITTIAVLPERQHGGIGSRLMVDLVEHARAKEARSIALEVRVANWPAQRLYAWFGFRPVGVRKNYYAETGEDALVMMVDDAQSSEIERRIARVRATIGC